MLAKDFNKVFDDTVALSRSVLVKKADEYATDDRLHNFKVAAALDGETPQKALAGMMKKHTVSIYDLCRDPGLQILEAWDEKIIDHINYLILLRAIVIEQINANKITLPIAG